MNLPINFEFISEYKTAFRKMSGFFMAYFMAYFMKLQSEAIHVNCIKFSVTSQSQFFF